MPRMWKVWVEYECLGGESYTLEGELFADNEVDVLRQAKTQVPAGCRVVNYKIEPLGLFRAVVATLKNIFW